MRAGEKYQNKAEGKIFHRLSSAEVRIDIA
ncbi:hypothetical protein ES705_39273 [subsurface metagenome]